MKEKKEKSRAPVRTSADDCPSEKQEEDGEEENGPLRAPPRGHVFMIGL